MGEKTGVSTVKALCKLEEIDSQGLVFFPRVTDVKMSDSNLASL